MAAYQFNNLWIGIALWLLLYTADYYLTWHGNRLRLKYSTAFIDIGGSYEVNPIYKKDVDAFRAVSPRFILIAGLYTAWLVFWWWLADATKITEFFTVALGLLLLPELAVIIEHFHNISSYNFMKVPGSIEGHIKYSYWMTVGLTARKFGYWALLWFILFLLTGNWLFIGGAIGSLRSFIRFNVLGVRLRRQTT